MTVTPTWPGFASGVISPRLMGRTDLAWTFAAMKGALNMVATPRGPVTRRGGTQYINDAYASTSLSTLMPMRFSILQAYMLEFSEKKMRVFKDRALVTGGTLPLTVPWTAAEAPDIRWAQSADILYLAHSVGKPQKISRTAHNMWTIADFDFQDGPYFPENTDSTKTLTASAITGSITVTAVGHTPFVATDVGRHIRLKPGSTWGWAEITAYTSSTVVTALVKGDDLSGTTATDAWRLGLFSDTTGWPAAIVIHQERMYLASQVAGSFPRLDGSEVGNFESFPPTDAAGAALDAKAVSYIVASEDVAVIRDIVSLRDIVALTTSEPIRFTGGALGEPMTPINVIALPLGLEPAGNVRPIKAQGSIIYTDFHERDLIELAFSKEAEGLRGKDLTLRNDRITHYGEDHAAGGVKRMAYQRKPENVCWAVRHDGALIGMTYKPSQDITAFHPHFLGGAVAGDAEPHGRVESIGVIPGAFGEDELWLSVKRTIAGGTKRTIEVLSTSFLDDDPIESAWFLDAALRIDNTGELLAGSGCTLVPGATTGNGVTFTAGAGTPFTSSSVGRRLKYRYPVGRDIDGFVAYETAEAEIKTFVSGTVVTGDIDRDFPSTAAIPADKWRLTLATIAGLGHIEGQTAGVFGDGAVQASQTVTGGAITLETQAATVLVGLDYQSYGQTMRLEVGSRQGSLQGKFKKTHRVDLRLHRTVGGRIGPRLDKLKQIFSRTTADQVGYRLEPFTGDRRFQPWEGEPDTDGYVFFEQSEPYPMTVVSVTPHFNPAEG